MNTQSWSLTVPPVPGAPPELHGRWTLAMILAGSSNQQIRRELAEDDLPCASDAELDGRREAHHMPSGFSFRGPWKRDARLFLSLRLLERLAEGAPETQRAVRILRSPRLRELVESGLLTGVPHDAIAVAVSALLETTADNNAIRTFAELFLRLDVVTRSQLRVLVEERVGCALRKVVSRKRLRRALARDARMIAVALPPTPANWSVALQAMGFAPTARHIIDMVAACDRPMWRVGI